MAAANLLSVTTALVKMVRWSFCLVLWHLVDFAIGTNVDEGGGTRKQS